MRAFASRMFFVKSSGGNSASGATPSAVAWKIGSMSSAAPPRSTGTRSSSQSWGHVS